MLLALERSERPSLHSALAFHQLEGCLEIREPLAWHLVRHLQHKLIIDGHAPASIRDQRFAGDLGL